MKSVNPAAARTAGELKPEMNAYSQHATAAAHRLGMRLKRSRRKIAE